MAKRRKDWASLDDLILLNISKYLLWPDRVRAAQVCGNWNNSFLPGKLDTIVRVSFEDGCPRKAGSDEVLREEKSDEACSASNSAEAHITSKTQQLIINVCPGKIGNGIKARSYMKTLMKFKDIQLQVFSLRFCNCDNVNVDYDCRYGTPTGDAGLKSAIDKLISKNGSLEVINIAAPIDVNEMMRKVATLPQLAILRLRTFAGGYARTPDVILPLSKLLNLQEFQFHLDSLRDVLELIGRGELESRSPIHLSVVCSNDPVEWRKPGSANWRHAVQQMNNLTVSFIFEEGCSENIVHACLDNRRVPLVDLKLFLNLPSDGRVFLDGKISTSLAESIQLHAPTLKYFSFAGPQGAVCAESMSSLLSKCTQLQKVTIYGRVKQETLDQWRKRYSQCTFTVLAHGDVYMIRKPPVMGDDDDDYSDYSDYDDYDYQYHVDDYDDDYDDYYDDTLF